MSCGVKKYHFLNNNAPKNQRISYPQFQFFIYLLTEIEKEDEKRNLFTAKESRQREGEKKEEIKHSKANTTKGRGKEGGKVEYVAGGCERWDWCA